MPVRTFTRPASIQLTATTFTVLPSQTGTTFIATLASGTQVFTLPPIARNPAGLVYSFICGNAAGEILINPASTADDLLIKATEDAGASVNPAAGTGVKNTASGNVIGDHITLVSDGVSRWYMIGQSGAWATQ